MNIFIEEEECCLYSLATTGPSNRGTDADVRRQRREREPVYLKMAGTSEADDKTESPRFVNALYIHTFVIPLK